MYLEIPNEYYKRDKQISQKGLIIRDGGSI